MSLFVGIPEAARLIGVQPLTVRRWVYLRRIPAAQVGPRGRWRIPVAWIEELVARRVVVEEAGEAQGVQR